MLLNVAAHIEGTATQFPPYALLHLVTCVPLRLTTNLGNCGCVAVTSFLGVPPPLDFSWGYHDAVYWHMGAKVRSEDSDYL
jgi:hypothetical protein